MQAFHYIAGLGFLALAKTKHLLRGYVTPKPYTLDDTERCIAYDIAIANRYIDHLARFDGSRVEGKHILELGPGSDLGIGLLLVAAGAGSYVGFDRHDLASGASADFYRKLAERTAVDLSALTDGRVRYVTRQDFDLTAGIEPGIDLVVSNAAFEHFDDIARTISQLTQVTKPGARVVAEVDLQTHSRWIREADPNNIYRYPEWLYRAFRFPGQPNRERPDTYRQLFEACGWSSVTLWPENQLGSEHHHRRVHPDFIGRNLDWLSFVLCAQRAERR